MNEYKALNKKYRELVRAEKDILARLGDSASLPMNAPERPQLMAQADAIHKQCMALIYKIARTPKH